MQFFVCKQQISGSKSTNNRKNVDPRLSINTLCKSLLVCKISWHENGHSCHYDMGVGWCRRLRQPHSITVGGSGGPRHGPMQEWTDWQVWTLGSAQGLWWSVGPAGFRLLPHCTASSPSCHTPTTSGCKYTHARTHARTHAHTHTQVYIRQAGDRSVRSKRETEKASLELWLEDRQNLSTSHRKREIIPDGGSATAENISGSAYSLLSGLTKLHRKREIVPNGGNITGMGTECISISAYSYLWGLTKSSLLCPMRCSTMHW